MSDRHVKVTSAPEPITPVRGQGARVAVRRKPATAPDWAYWPASRPVAPWHAVALSLNLDPDSLKHSPQAWMAGPDSGPILESEGFPDAEIEAAFCKRLALLVAFVSHSSRVPLGELAGMLIGHTLPPELATMATAPAATASPKETTKFGAGEATQATPQDSAKRRAKAALSTRGCKKNILENWDTIRQLHGPDADGHHVLRFFKNRKICDKLPTLKTIQNHLSQLKTEKLIP